MSCMSTLLNMQIRQVAAGTEPALHHLSNKSAQEFACVHLNRSSHLVVHLAMYASDTDLLCCHSDRLQLGLVEDTLLTAVGV